MTVYLHKNKTAKVRKGTAVMVYGHIKTAAGPVTGKYVRFYQRQVAQQALVLRAPHRRACRPTGWYSTVVRPRRSTTYKVVSFASTALQLGHLEPVTVRMR